jgi:hypothetical protein
MSMSEEETRAFEEAIQKKELVDVLGNPLQEEMMDQIHKDFNRSEWVETSDGSEPEFNDLKFEQVRNILRSTQGKVLTIIDATFTDEKRLKYVKDLVKDAFSSQANWLFELATGDFENNGDIVVENQTKKVK